MSVLSALPVSGWALGLGKLNVQSALGEPLRAEIDVSSLTSEEGATLQVKVATPETYRAAGVDFNAVLSSTQITLQRRADGRPFLRIASDRLVQEPFVDVILDLSWSSGRLVREYTLLFDPPAVRQAAQAAPAPTAPVMDAPADTLSRTGAATKPASRAPAVTESPAKARTTKAAKAPASAASAAEPAVAAAPAPAPSAPAGEGDARSVRVKSGDSLSLIAQRNAAAGVSLDQMLVSLYRNNPQAFQGNNMNRLKAGAVLNVPSADEAQKIGQPEARQVIVAQSADFAAYRQRLATGVTAAPAEQAERQAKGKVEAEVQDRKQAAAPTPDKLTLSKGGMGTGSNAGVEDRVAKARAKEDSSARVAELSKNLDELRKLKDKATPAPVPAPTPAPAQPPASAPLKAVPAPVPASAPSLAPSVAVTPSAPASAALAEAMASAASTPSEGAATAVADQASAPAAPPSRPTLPAPVAPPPAEEPGFLESLNPMLLAAGGAGVALLAGVAMFLRSRRRTDTGETSFLESRLQPDSFFGASGGQRVDTRDASAGPSSMSYSLSQLDAIGDVDPVAEADVYLAYGRDLQAEEILKEALRSTPDRLAIRTKLLEVYAKRRDTKGYEQLASQLHSLTQGQGDDWAKAQELGLSIDPENPLYQPGGQPSSTPLSVEAPADVLGASTIPHSVMPAPSALDSVAPALPETAPARSKVDLDLDISAAGSLDSVTDSVSPITESGDLPSLQLPEFGDDLPQGQATAPAAFTSRAPEPMDLPSLESLDQGLAFPASAPVAAPAPAAGLDFDLESVLPAAEPAPAPAFDLSDISLDLGAASPPALEPVDSQQSLSDLSNDPMARKLELADEFRQIGDTDGARELLQEVIDNAGDGGLRAKAQTMLDSLG
ncbi:FimV/HubP family polar landmark protein [Aquabacterium sp.]|uniref:FimV/HubP family polar landmark protein n=1 Tax=Aquabacterium sp. TaxID=1872578 RepID=UPI0035C68C59